MWVWRGSLGEGECRDRREGCKRKHIGGGILGDGDSSGGADPPSVGGRRGDGCRS